MIDKLKTKVSQSIKHSELTSHAQMLKQIKVQKLTLITFAIVIALLCWTIHLSQSNQFVIVKNGKEVYQYGSNWASTNVFEDAALTDANLFFNITPSNAKIQGELFLNTVAPSLYDAATNLVKTHINDLKQNHYSMSFQPDFTKSTFNKKGDVKLVGSLIKYQGGMTEKPQQMTIYAHYSVIFGTVQKTDWRIVYEA
ncbi:MAG: TraE/TraK family type IV conjugative transfer system protein [Proteobacteria bacterium]|nr:TraE/TraK family type IV conjugative transfer system protein [Pseudomonadota bacterium]